MPPFRHGDQKGDKGKSTGKTPIAKGQSVDKGKSKGKGKFPVGKGKGKGASATSSFNGYCHRCGKYGHRVRDCFVKVNSLEEPSQNMLANTRVMEHSLAPSSVGPSVSQRPASQLGDMTKTITDIEWLFMAEKLAVGQEYKKTFDFGNIVLLLVDSGAFDHVCPLAFADWLKLDADDSIKGEVVGAGGEIRKHFGHRKIIFDLFGRGRLLVNFHVLDVRRPIISVSKIIQRGYMVVFGKQSYT